MKKGFTLIELLAVIVILAIIALIATPIVLNIINDTKESAVIRSAEYYMDAVEQAIARKNLTEYFNPTNCNIQNDGNLLCNEDNIPVEVDVKGEKATKGSISFIDNEMYIDLVISNNRIMTNAYGELEYVPDPGLYDKDGKLLASWDELVAEYDIKTLIENGGLGEGGKGLAGEAIDSITGAHKLVIDENVTKIGESAFSLCSSLTSIIIPNSVTSIGDDAFSGCENLNSIVIPYGIASIEDETFYGSALKKVIIPNSVTSIGVYAFYESYLTSITIPSSVTSIGTAAFYGCSNLKSINLPSTLTSIGLYTFSYSALTSIIIPEGVTSIEMYAFFGCENLKTVNLPSTLIDIGVEAFDSCTSLTSITIPEGVTDIHSEAFAESGLTSITIPSSVTRIDDNVFYGSDSLTTIYYKGNATGFPWGAPNNPTLVTDF